ncbi:hypothetical protein [Treponema sp. SP13]|uniref:hypothetical protein n=1 Tax=Treponema sp. SP13 TaxID=2789742 RepID=UPI003D93891E
MEKGLTMQEAADALNAVVVKETIGGAVRVAAFPVTSLLPVPNLTAAGLEWFVREVRLDITKLMSIASVCDGSRYSAYVPKNTARIFFPEKEGGTQHPASWVIPTGGGIPADIVDMLADWEDDDYEEFSDEDAADEAQAREAESKAETADKEAGGSHEQRP